MRLLVRTANRTLRLLVALAALTALGALLVGVPWGLVTFIGWPLPDHVPTADEIEATLLNPLSVTTLLDILACIAWPTWLVFAVDVARCVPDALRGVRTPMIGPMRTVAGILVALVLFGLLQPRSPAATTSPLSSARPASTVMVAHTDPSITVDSLGTTHSSKRTRTATAQDIVVVRPPRGGVHDSLWRIAQRVLGDGKRWVDLFRINEGRPQPDGRALTNPHLIQPGWVLRLPEEATPQPAPPPREQHPLHPALSEPTPQQQPPETAPDRSQESAASPEVVTTTSGSAITLWSGGLVAAALASVITLAMARRRRRRMRTYVPGSGDRTPPPEPAPAVHALRLAYDEAQLDETNSDDGELIVSDGQPHTLKASLTQSGDDSTAVEIGIHDQRTHALDLAAVHGLGLTGAGAEATVRSLLVHLLATTHATAVIPADDARALLGSDLPDSSRLSVTDTLDTAITDLVEWPDPIDSECESTTLTAVLVARIDHPHAQLQSVLEVGSANGVAGLLLGHWQPGATVRVRADGIVAAASPSIDDLRGSRLFHLDATDTRDLLTWLAAAPLVTSKPRSDTAAESAHDEPDPTTETELAVETEPPDQPTGGWDSQVATELEPEADSAPAESTDDPHDTELTAQETEDTETREPIPPITVDDESETEPPVLSESSDVSAPVGVSERSSREYPERPLALSVFGPVTLTWYDLDGSDHDLTSALAPKHKALLAFLALHPAGTTREAVREALWPEARGRRPFNAFYAGLSQIRKVLSQATSDQAVDLIDQHDEQLALHPALVEVDYWQLHQAEHERRIATTDEQRMTAWSRVVAAYRGEIADGMSALWLDGPREAAHRSVVDALAGMAAHYRGHEPQRQLQLLEHARLLDPENEDIYRDIMRVQAQLGLTDAISRTVQLLTTTLADIGERPDPNTLALARALQARHHRMAS